MMLCWTDDKSMLYKFSSVGLVSLKCHHHAIIVDEMNLKNNLLNFFFILLRNSSRHQHNQFILVMFPYFFLTILWGCEAFIPIEVVYLFYITMQRRWCCHWCCSLVLEMVVITLSYSSLIRRPFFFVWIFFPLR